MINNNYINNQDEISVKKKKRICQFPSEFDDAVKSFDEFTRYSLTLDVLELIIQYLLPNTQFGVIIQVIFEDNYHLHFCDLFDSSTGKMVSRHLITTPNIIKKNPERTCVSIPIECARVCGELVLPVGIVFSDMNGCAHLLTCKTQPHSTFELALSLESPLKPPHLVNSGWKFVYGFITSSQLLILYNDEQQMTFIWNIGIPKVQCVAQIDQGYAYHISLMYNPLRLVIPSRMEVHLEYLTCIYDLSKYENVLVNWNGPPDKLSPRNPEVPHLVYKKFTTVLENGCIAALSRGRLAIYEEKSNQEKRETTIRDVLEKKIIEPLMKKEVIIQETTAVLPKPLMFWFANATIPLNDTIPTLLPLDFSSNEVQEFKKCIAPPAPASSDFRFINVNVYEEPASPLIPFIPNIDWDDYHPSTHFKKTLLARADGEVYPTFYPNSNIFQMSNGWLMIPPKKKKTKEENNQLARFQLVKLASHHMISDCELPLSKDNIRSIVSLPGNEIAILTTQYEEILIYDVLTKRLRKIPCNSQRQCRFPGEKRRIYTDMFRLEPIYANRVPFLRMWQKDTTFGSE